MIWERSFLFLLSILIRHLIKIKIHISELGRSRASAHELQLIDGGDFQKKDVSEIEKKCFAIKINIALKKTNHLKY